MHDVIVIGGGPGGYAAAIRASQLGGKVALAEAGKLGGTCVNRGCIPSKVWHRAAYLRYWMQKADFFGIKATVEGMDFPALINLKNNVADGIRMGMEGLLKNNGVDFFQGRATIQGPGAVSVEGTILNGSRIILATGSSPVIPDIPGLKNEALTIDQTFDLENIPDSILVVGSGPQEVEIATLLNIFGAKVTLAMDSPRILPHEDHDTSQRISQALRTQGVDTLPRFSLTSVKTAAGKYEAVLSGSEERTITIDKIFIGDRVPNIEGLGLDTIGVKLNDEGGVSVNERLETSVEGVYAIGDVTGGLMLSHAASAMAVTAAENAMGSAEPFPFNLVPRGIWSFPEVGAVGLSESEAEEMEIEVKVGDFPYSINGVAMLRDEAMGAVKIVSDAEYGEILGVHIVGAHATEVIGEAVLAMQFECTAEELAKSIRVHPTFSESVVDSSRDVMDWALYLPKR